MITISINLDGVKSNENSNIKVSGLLKSHYSPKAAVFIDLPPSPGDGFIAMNNIPTPSGVIRLASPISIEQYAKDFYNALRLGDKKGLKRINVIQPEGSGLAEAIRDRLSKAASR
jgi:L-threonylcarbamoyladenylate synthase